MRELIKKIVTDVVTRVPAVQLLEAQNRFLLQEVQRINQERRMEALGSEGELESLARQTRESFDYQWSEFHEGVAMPSDTEWMKSIENRICELTGRPRDWFAGRRVADIGCGAGRWTYGMLSMGAHVTACDQSEAALRRTAEVGASFADRLATKKIDLLTWDDPGDFELVFCFGVVHHTGNTYRALRNTALKVGPGGRLFVMIYAFPTELADFREQATYAEMRQKWRLLSLDERKQEVVDKFGAYLGHGWFDAVSPQVNDLLSFEEIAHFFRRLGFGNIRRAAGQVNHHVTADRLA